MKKYKYLSLLSLVPIVISGCSSSKEVEPTIVRQVVPVESVITTVETETETEDEFETETIQTSKYLRNITETEIETETEDDTIEVESVDELDYKTFAEYQMKDISESDIVATLHIKDKGDIKIKLFKEAAPKAVENFVTLSKNGYYDNLTFHRVIYDYIIQSGDPNGDNTGGESIWGEPFENECTLELVPYKGTLCMANRGADNTNTSQFFICTGSVSDDIVEELKDKNYPESLIEQYQIYGGSPWLYQSYTVFGQVMEGLDVVEAIQTVETDDNDKPIEDVIIESIDIVEPIKTETEETITEEVLGIGTIINVNEYVNIYSSEDFNSNKLESINLGNTCEVIGESGDWYKVKVNDVTGFVQKKYIELNEEQTEAETEIEKEIETELQTEVETESELQIEPLTEVETEINKTGKVINVNEFINLYRTPDLNSEKDGKLNLGETCEVIEESGDWCKVKTKDVSGWTQKKYIE